MNLTQQQVIAIATRLFPDSVTDGSDCQAEIGREGQPCRACFEKNREWNDCLETVKAAIEAELS